MIPVKEIFVETEFVKLHITFRIDVDQLKIYSGIVFVTRESSFLACGCHVHCRVRRLLMIYYVGTVLFA